MNPLCDIHAANIHSVNLNLLVALEAFLDERSVTRAAERTGVTQPAMSNTLAQLRTLFDDPLFRRGAHGLEPTPRARWRSRCGRVYGCSARRS